jgi:alanyl-tRNA synthetase
MSDDWRLHVTLADQAEAGELAERLAKFNSEHQLGSGFSERVVVSRDGSEVFCYAETREQAEAAERAIRSLAAEQHWQPTTELRRWHPVAEEWEDPDKPLPATEAQRSGEHAELVEEEREESRTQGFPDFEVRVRCASRRDAQQLAERLRSEGIPNVHRWHFVVVGATDEDSANQLAQRIRSEAPPGTEVTAEASIQEITAEAPEAGTPYNNPFAVFGGLGG